MKFVDFNNCDMYNRAYDGASGAKLSILYQNKPYMLKFPKILKQRSPMNHMGKSRSDSSISEYLGSHVYASLGIKVHQTILGLHSRRLVVACEDFCRHGDVLQEFTKLKTTMEPQCLDHKGNVIDGLGTELDEVLQVISEHPRLQDKPEIKERFWDMMIVDALIGNGNRNNDNWGVILRYNGAEELAPVYSNGDSFHHQWDDEQMQRVLADGNCLRAQAYQEVTCAYLQNGRAANPFDILEQANDEICLKELHTLIPKIIQVQPLFNQMVNDLCSNDLVTPIKADFLKALVDLRITGKFIPLFRDKFHE